jgi:hypothetical protein
MKGTRVAEAMHIGSLYDSSELHEANDPIDAEMLNGPPLY